MVSAMGVRICKDGDLLVWWMITFYLYTHHASLAHHLKTIYQARASRSYDQRSVIVGGDPPAYIGCGAWIMPIKRASLFKMNQLLLPMAQMVQEEDHAPVISTTGSTAFLDAPTCASP